MLRYAAVLEPPEGRRLISVDAGRAFVLSFWLADQTLGVFEPPQPNSGSGGKFLERGRVYKPGNKLVRAGRLSPGGPPLLAAAGAAHGACNCPLRFPPQSAHTPQSTNPVGPGPVPALPPPQAWFTEADLAVGAVLELHGRRFRITEADEFTRQWRQAHG